MIKYPGKVEIMKDGKKVEELASSEKQQVDKKNIKSTLKKNTGGRNVAADPREEGKGGEQNLETYSKCGVMQSPK